MLGVHRDATGCYELLYISARSPRNSVPVDNVAVSPPIRDLLDRPRGDPQPVVDVRGEGLVPRAAVRDARKRGRTTARELRRFPSKELEVDAMTRGFRLTVRWSARSLSITLEPH